MYLTSYKYILKFDNPIFIDNYKYIACDFDGSYYTKKELKEMRSQYYAIIISESEYESMIEQYDPLFMPTYYCY